MDSDDDEFLGDELQQLIVLPLDSLAVKHVDPPVGHLGDLGVA